MFESKNNDRNLCTDLAGCSCRPNFSRAKPGGGRVCWFGARTTACPFCRDRDFFQDACMVDGDSFRSWRTYRSLSYVLVSVEASERWIPSFPRPKGRARDVPRRSQRHYRTRCAAFEQWNGLAPRTSRPSEQSQSRVDVGRGRVFSVWSGIERMARACIWTYGRSVRPRHLRNLRHAFFDRCSNARLRPFCPLV